MSVSPSKINRLSVAAPGRINLLGEHTDYNEGFVLPAAIGQQMVFTFEKNGSSNQCRITSASLGKTMQADLGHLQPSGGWENYISGVLRELLKRSGKLEGFDVDFKSNIPAGAGLSSSAALECGLAFGLNVLFELGLSPLELIRLSQEAEHNFVGTQCGIMDQFACVMGRKNHFILLDCRDLQHRYIPADLGNCSLLLMGSGIKHALAESAYNERRAECQRGVAVLRETFPEIRSLRDATAEHLNALADVLPNTVKKRCRYVIEENARVLQAVQALENRDMEGLGALLSQSHRGLRDDYQVSCPEVDFLVDTALSFPGVLGARIMGGGFGGCSLNLVRSEDLEWVQTALCKAYRESFGREAEPLEVRISDGVRICS
ncbi:MAG: galactokinase [Robiginitalea sp.]|uniref:galactokinase n=1 Tax=Robiginitalea sp. TaxID=1902411 RepID=UPI003C75C349